MAKAPDDWASSTAYGVTSMPSAGMPRSASAIVSLPGPDPTSRVGPWHRSTSDQSPGVISSHCPTASGTREPSECSTSACTAPASAAS